MANPHEGEVAIVAGDQTYRFVLDARAIASLEREFGRLEDKPLVGMRKVFAYLNEDDIGITVMSLWLWAGLRRHHKAFTIAEAENLVVLAGGAPKLVPIFFEAARLAFPDSEADPPPMPDQNQNGTGPASSLNTSH